MSFTGSNDVGTGLYSAAAARGIKCQCEMGGKNPIVILADADLDLAVESTVQGAFGSTGQRCTATSRAVVDESIANEFVERLEARTASLVVGNGLNPGTNVGPSVDERQLETVLDYVEIGKQRGGAAGARRRSRPRRGPGPWLLRVARHLRPASTRTCASRRKRSSARSCRSSACRTTGTALSVANGVRFGLSASVYTTDVASMFRFVDQLDAGIIHVNSPTVGGEAHIPFGGMKATGVGLREMGRVAIDFYTELKVVYVDYTGGVRKTNLY